MNQQMSNPIEGNMHPYEEACDRLAKAIDAHCKEMGHNTTAQEVFKAYHMQAKGLQVSDTMRFLLITFGTRLVSLIPTS